LKLAALPPVAWRMLCRDCTVMRGTALSKIVATRSELNFKSNKMKKMKTIL
jgi:hypothetical protein